MAAAGVAASAWLRFPEADGIASVGIGLLLVLVAAFLGGETRSLLIGEAAAPPVVAKVETVIRAHRSVEAVCEILSPHFGPEEILFAITLDFRDDLPTGTLEAEVDALTAQIRAVDPRITRVFLRPGRPKSADRSPSAPP